MDIFAVKDNHFSDGYCVPFSCKNNNIKEKVDKLKEDITQLEEELNSSW